MEAREVAERAVRALDSKKGRDIRVIEIGSISTLADYFVLATGTSSTQVRALADEVEFQLQQAQVQAGHTEGYRGNSWVLLDYGSVVVHVFTPQARDFYDLDRLWKDGSELDISSLCKAD